MASTSEDVKPENYFNKMKHFPPVDNGRINVLEFLEATSDLVSLVERLGKVFAPVKYDMQGNIDKIKKHYKYDETSCLLQLMLQEETKGKPAAEGILWLNRALLFFEIVFQEIINSLHSVDNVNMKKIFTIAYAGSVKKYHNWVTQQLFVVICKMSPTLPEILKSFGVNNDIKGFETNLSKFNTTLRLTRCKIDDFFNENNFFNT